MPIRRQAIIWIIDGLSYWLIYALFGLNELRIRWITRNTGILLLSIIHYFLSNISRSVENMCIRPASVQRIRTPVFVTKFSCFRTMTARQDADLSNPLKPVPHFNTKNVVPGTNIPIIKISLSWIGLVFVIGTLRRRFSGGIYMRQRTRSWLVQVKRIAWRYQAITCTSVGLSTVSSSNIHLRAVSQELPQQSINKISFKFAYLKFRSNLLGTNGLQMPKLTLSSIPRMIHPHQFILATV